MLQDYLQAMLMILIAEMGDKTQILAMAFATQYKVRQIVLGVAIGSFLNHGLAILLGSFLTKFVPMDLMQLVAGFMFLFFAFWSLKADDDEESSSASKFGPVLTVALAFFLGELGDKTQLTALTLSTQAGFPALTLAGTVTGMVLTSLVGIWVGAKLGHKIPEMQLKLGAFAVFVFFGLEKVINSPYRDSVPVSATIVGLLSFVGLSFWMIRKFLGTMRRLEETSLKRQAEALFNFAHGIKPEIEALCLGTEHCEECKGDQCLVGFLKTTIERLEKGLVVDDFEIERIQRKINRSFNRVQAHAILVSLKHYYDHNPSEFADNETLKALRITLEHIIFGESFETVEHYEAYVQQLLEKDSSFGLNQL